MKDIKIVIRDIDDIKPYELNAKNHDDKQVEKIAKSITEFGWDQPIVVDKSGVIIKGHGRRLAAVKLGLKNVPVLVRDDLTDEQVRAARLADNRVAISDIDTDILQKELASLSFDLNGIFDGKELTFMEVDLGEMNMDAIVQDMDSEVKAQSIETAKKIEEADIADVRLDKVLGFKVIKGKEERYVARFMAMIEAETGLPPDRAFVQFAKQYIETQG